MRMRKNKLKRINWKEVIILNKRIISLALAIILAFSLAPAVTAYVVDKVSKILTEPSVLIYEIYEEYYIVTYDTQGGTPTPPPQMVLRGESASVSYSLPIRLGYTFMGWCTDTSGNGEYLQRGYDFAPDSDMQLYAIWRLDEHYGLNEITSPGIFHDYFKEPTEGFQPYGGSCATLEAYRYTRYQAYRVWLEHGQEITAFMDSNDFDSYLYLLDPDGYYITEDDDSGGNFNALITYIIMEDGFYYILASQWWGSNGDYSLSISTREIPMLTVGSAVAGAGNEVTIPVFASGSPYLASLSFRVSYDENEMKLIDATLPNFSDFNIEIGSAPQELVSLVPKGTAQVDPNGILLYLTFEISNYAWPGDYFIDLFNIRATDENDNNITFVSKYGCISVYSYEEGYRVTGQIKSYNPLYGATVQLKQNDNVRYETTIPDDMDRFGQLAQDFELKSVAPGEYMLVITKKLHTTFNVEKIIVGDEDLDLTKDSRAEVRLMNLRCGDINSDGYINDSDLTVLWTTANYNKPAIYPANPLCDLNGDGYINDNDLTILWMAYNYNKGAVIVS